MESQLDQAFQLVVEPNTLAIKKGEHLLQLLQKNSEYPLALLHYINNPGVNQQRKLNASIQLKLWCNTYKNLEQFERQYYSHIINDITKGILIVYLNFPLKISKTLREGIVSLADVHFHKDWNDLLSNLLAYANQTPSGIPAVLKLIQSITNKYHRQSRSDPLYQQIIFVCDQLHDFLLALTHNVLSRVKQNQDNINQVEILEILMKIFYNLNYQDLHPKFEDNLANWMNVLKQVMNIKNANQNIFKCKGAALEAILLYASKYKEDVEEPIKGFCQQIWQLCANASDDPQYDDIVFNCLKFFKSLMMWPQMKGFFNSHMSSLFENLILPNIGITNTMVGLFEEQIDLFIDYYFRNTQLQTRRAAALEILRVICRYYDCFSAFLEHQLQNFQGQIGNIKSLCTILNFTIDGSSKGFRDVDGCTQLFVSQQIINYTYQNIAKKSLFQVYDWMTKNEPKLIESKFDKIHIAVLLRFLFYFRIYVPKQELVSIVKFLTSIKTQNKQLKKVIYLTLNGFLIMKHGDFNYYKNMQTFFVAERAVEIAADVLKVVYEGTICQDQLQLSLTKMFYNMTRALAAKNGDFFQMIILIVKEMLKRTALYDFETVQFFFEAIGFVVYWLIKANSQYKSKLEGEMTNFFLVALNNKSDLLNFCLQILAIFLQLEPSTSQQYKNIYESLLLQQNWKEQNQSLMSSYIQFLISYVSKFKERLIQDKSSIEIILSKIIEIDHIELFYRFLQAIMLNTTLMQFFDSGYLMLTLQGGQVISKSITGRKASLMFICKLTLNYDMLQLLQLINRCFNHFYDQLLEASLDVVRTLSNRAERKYLFSSICRAIKANYFNDHRFVGVLINNLVSNTAQKFNFTNMQNIINERQAKDKKESTYKKLVVFKEFEVQQKQIMIDQEQQLVRTCHYIQGIDPSIIDMLDGKNKDRLVKMHQKFTR